MIRTAIIEDDLAIIERLQNAIESCDDVQIIAIAHNASDGMALITAGGFDVLLCDIGLPDGNGIDLIRAASKNYPDSDIIVITIFADQSKVLSSIKAGARGYILKDEKLDDCVSYIRDIQKGGSPISPMIARQLLRQLRPNTDVVETPLANSLSAREAEVLNLLARGFTYAEISGFLSISVQTVGTYVKRLYNKLEVKSRSEAVFEASSRGIIDVH